MSKSTGLFVTEAQCAERLGLSLEQFKLALLAASKEGFPPEDELFADRRYWPAVKTWLDHRYGLLSGSPNLQARGMTAPPGLDGKENWD